MSLSAPGPSRGAQRSCGRAFLVSSISLILGAALALPVSGAAPETRVSAAAADTLHGRVIPDPYRWLEDFESDEAQAWIEAQHAFTDEVLGAFPGRERVRQRLDELFQIPHLGGLSKSGERIFFTRRDPENEQAVLYFQDGLSGESTLLIDPDALGDGTRVGLDWWYPSVDGHLLAYGLSEEGSESSVLYVVDVDGGELLPDTIPNTRAASLAWEVDGSGFYYTRFPGAGEVPEDEVFFHRKIYYHRIGDDWREDQLVEVPDLDMYAWPGASLSSDGRFLLAYVFRGHTRNDIYVMDREEGGGFVPLAEGLDGRFSGVAIGETFYFTTSLDSPNGRLLSTDLRNPATENWIELIPEGDHAMQSHAVAGDMIVAHYLEDARSVFRVYTKDGLHLHDVPIPEFSSVFDWSCDWRTPELLLGVNSYLLPPTTYHYDIPSEELTLFKAVEAPIDAAPYVTKQVWFESADGTRVPMFVVHRRDIELDGDNPTLLVGYGGFKSSSTPAFARNRFLWMDSGGVYAEANLRGGGEYGDSWHRDGMLENKQNSFDDFIAAAEWLIDSGYTNRDKLAVWGGSNGGLLIGAFVTQRPDLARAAICDVPLLDMVRFHKFYGASMWTTEYGNPEEPEQFEWLYAYSPYHHIESGGDYPSMLITTAESDTRVHPSHAMKMTARLQAEQGSGRPVMLRFEREAGHGSGTPMSMLLDQYTDYYSFLFGQLNVDY
jgi:prolyl oligopeptidase